MNERRAAVLARLQVIATEALAYHDPLDDTLTWRDITSGNSLELIVLAEEIEREFNVLLEIREVIRIRTVGDLVTMLIEHEDGAPTKGSA